MPTIELDKKNKDYLLFKCQYAEKEKAKSVSDAKWDKEQKGWAFPATSVKVKSLQKVFPDLIIPEDVKLFINNNIASDRESLEIKALQDCELDTSLLKTSPFKYQKVGIKFMLSRDEAANFCELGTGKTFQTLATIVIKKQEGAISKCLVVCPASLKYNWSNEIIKHTHESSVVADGPKKKRVEIYEEFRTSDVVFLIINYELMRMDISIIKKFLHFDAIILDESVKIKNDQAKQTQAIKELSYIKHKYILSGYPIANNVIDIWSQIDFLKPGKLGTFWSFEDNYVERGYFKEIVGYRNLEILQKKLDPLYIRFLKKDVLDLPEKIYQNREVVLEKDQEKHYNQMRDEMMVYLEGLSEQEVITKTRDILTKMIRLSQITSGFVSDNQLQNPYFTHSNAKLSALKDIVDEVMSNGKSIVIWCRFIPTVHSIVDFFKEKYSIGVLTGSSKNHDRQQLVDDFQNGKIKIFVGQILAGGMGINLFKADTEVFFEKSFLSPSSIVQAEDRCVVEGSSVCTKNGFINIENLSVNDLVLTHKGKYKPIEKVYKRNYANEIIDICTWKTYENLKLTPDHPVLVLGKNKTTEWKEAKNISCNDYIAFPKIKKMHMNATYNFVNPKKYFKNSFGVIQKNGRLKLIDEKINISDDRFLYIAGWFLSEGWVTNITAKSKNHSIGFAFRKSTERKYLLLIRKYIKELFNIDGKIYESKKFDTISLNYKSKALWKLFQELFGKGAHDKFIHESLMNLAVEKSKILLSAYLLGDGYKRNNYQEYVTVSQKLAYQVRELCIDSGYFPSLRRVMNKCGNFEYYGLYSICDKNAYRLETKESKKYIFNKVKEIHRYTIPRIKVYNLRVKDDNTYCLNYGVIHNCHRIGQTNNVTIISLIARDTLDMRWEKLVAKKRDVAEQILGDKPLNVNRQLVMDLIK